MGFDPRWPLSADSSRLILAVAIAVTAMATCATSGITLLAEGATLSQVDPTPIALGFTLAAVGAVIAVRVPRNPIGWLFLAAAFIAAIEAASTVVVFWSLVLGTVPHDAGVWAEWVINWLGGLLFPAGIVAVVLLLLPTGQLPSRRWRCVLFAGPVIVAVMTFGLIFVPGPMKNATDVPAIANPTGVPALSPLSSPALGDIVWNVALVYALVAVCAPLARIRHASAEERQQLKWIGWPLAVTTFAYAAVAVGSSGVGTRGDSLPGWLVVILGYGTAFPVAIGIAILKYRLYGIDRAINRTIVYSILAVFITVVYLAIAAGIGSLVGSGSNLALSLIATVIVAAGFSPVRERARRFANRVVYGTRATPFEALARFSEHAAAAYPADEVLPLMARVVAEGTRALSACVWLRADGGLAPATIWPASAELPAPLPSVDGHGLSGGGYLMPVRQGSELLGALSVHMRPGESLQPIESSLLTHLADQAGLFLKNAALTADLQRSIADLRASRRRIARAEDEARRQIERDLHDGAQQHLVALTFQLGRAEQALLTDPGSIGERLSALRLKTEEALDAVRELAHGVYPALLADRGLGPALAAHARRLAVEVIIRASDIARYSAEAEAAIYFCVLEALQNADKHSCASRVEVELSEDRGQLSFSVRDDGIGFERGGNRQAGAGLENMTDRIAAEGGSLSIDSGPGRGTTITGRVPVSRVSAPVA